MKSNYIVTPSKNNIIIQDSNESILTLSVNGEILEIKNQLQELKVLLSKNNIQHIQYADKIYNIEHINEANFGEVTSNRLFNGILVKELINALKDKPKPALFLNNLPEQDRQDWECHRMPLQEAQSILEDSFVWIIGWELRRLFSIGIDRQKNLEIKINEYVSHCISTYRYALQISNALLLSRLWDEKKKNPTLRIRAKPLRDFFYSERVLKLTELRHLNRTLLSFFVDNHLEIPGKKEEWGELSEYIRSDSGFTRACADLENLEDLNPDKDTYGLGHCHTAEIAIACVLTHFRFFANYQLVTIKQVEYEHARSSTPRYIKDFSVLQKKGTYSHQRILKYDDSPSFTYALLFRNEHYSVNLFPFVLDYNTLTNEMDFQIYCYECREGLSGLRYFAVKSEKNELILYHNTASQAIEIKSEEQKIQQQRNIKLDLVIKQFEEALNTILDDNIKFEPLADKPDMEFLKNI